jgi:precorrin-6Y C5,15-methyltransferase (decarboxylating)
VLASGDPFFYGVGSVLANHVTPEETVVVPAPSAFSLAAARLGWALPDIALVSVHGRELDRIRPHLHPGARVLALTSDSEGPAALRDFWPSLALALASHVLEALGGASERVRATTAASFDLATWPRSTPSPSRWRPRLARGSSPLAQA